MVGGFPDGFCVEFDRQTYRPVGLRDHVTRGGEVVALVEWATECPSCGASFVVATNLTFRMPPPRRRRSCQRGGVNPAEATRLQPLQRDRRSRR